MARVVTGTRAVEVEDADNGPGQRRRRGRRKVKKRDVEGDGAGPIRMLGTAQRSFWCSTTYTVCCRMDGGVLDALDALSCARDARSALGTPLQSYACLGMNWVLFPASPHVSFCIYPGGSTQPRKRRNAVELMPRDESSCNHTMRREDRQKEQGRGGGHPWSMLLQEMPGR